MRSRQERSALVGTGPAEIGAASFCWLALAWRWSVRWSCTKGGERRGWAQAKRLKAKGLNKGAITCLIMCQAFLARGEKNGGGGRGGPAAPICAGHL